MAKFNYETIFAGAGFAGAKWDIAQGHNVTYTTTTGDLVFDDTTKTLTLSAGTWPNWIKEVGKSFVTDSATNPGPFTVVSVDGTSKILTVLEAVTDETPAGVTVINGSADTQIQSVLLSAGNGALTEDCPHVVVSTGALGAARTLSIAALEVESAAKGAQPLPGRFFYLSVQNSDISSTNSITISSSATINGAASLVISSTGDYLFHHVENGVWRVNTLARPAEPLAVLARIPFVAADWKAGTNKNTIKVLQSGTPIAGEIGPHNFAAYGSYLVQVINTSMSPAEQVDVEVQFANDGSITLRKAQKAADFNGVVVISGTLD